MLDRLQDIFDLQFSIYDFTCRPPFGLRQKTRGVVNESRAASHELPAAILLKASPISDGNLPYSRIVVRPSSDTAVERLSKKNISISVIT